MIHRIRRALSLAAVLWIAATGELMAAGGVLIDDFDGPDFAVSGGLYYKKNFEQSAGTVEFQNQVTHGGGGALKLTVRPLCDPGGKACSERAEIWEKPELRVPFWSGVWYGFAVKFGDPVPDDDHRYLIAQWKREIVFGAPGDFSPFLALRLKNGKLFATVETDFRLPPKLTPASTGGQGCSAARVPVWLRPDTNQMRALVATSPGWTPEDGALYADCTDRISVVKRGNDLPPPDAGWIDFAIFSKPGPDGSGHVEIFANGKWIVTVKGMIGQEDPWLRDNQYFKFGPYRAPKDTVWTMYYDDFRRSPNCADVLKGAPCPF